MSEYTVWLCDPQGFNRRQLATYTSLDVVASLNNVASISLTLPADAGLWPLLRRNSRIEVFAGDDLLFETIFFLSGRRWRRGLHTAGAMELRGAGASVLLRRRIVDYTAGSSQAEKNETAAYMLYELVLQNLGIDAGANRTINGPFVGFDVVESFVGMVDISKAMAWRTLLDVLQEISATSVRVGDPTYFDLTAQRTPTESWPHQFAFRTYRRCRGRDRRSGSGAPLLFSAENGSIADLELADDWSDEINAVTVGGQGQGGSRTVVRVTDDSRIGSDPLARVEAFVDAKSSVGGALTDEGRQRLHLGRPRRTISGAVQEVPGYRFGVDWGWGDLVGVQVDDEIVECMIDTVRVQVAAGKQTISARLRSEALL